MIVGILLIIFTIIFTCLYLTNQCKRPAKYPPGPPWLPFVGNLPELQNLSRIFKGQHLAFLALAKKYSSDVIGLKLGNEHVVAVCSYTSVKTVLTSEEYEGRPDNFFFRIRCLGTRKGITGTDGELWKEQRTFLVTHLKSLGFGKNVMEDMVKEEIQHFIEKIERNVEDIDVAEALSPSVLSILWTLTSGKSLRGNEHVNKLIKLLYTRSKAFDMSGGVLNNHPWLRHIFPEKTGYNLLRKINADIKSFIMESIEEHKKNWDGKRNDDVIYAFLNKMKILGQDSYYTDDQLVMVCLDVFIAGSTTTSNVISFSLLAMILYPEVQEKVYKNIIASFGTNENISYSDKKRVPYIEAVLLECQRFYPVAPLIGPRRVLKTTMLEDYIIPKNTTVLINIHSVHQEKDYWKDPERFRPERFLDKDGKLTAQDRILTFGLGKRRCLGDALAKTCIFLYFVTILRKFKIELKNNDEKPSGQAVPGITMSPEKYRAKFVPRQK